MYDKVLSQKVDAMKSVALLSALSLGTLLGANAPSSWTGDLSPITADDWNYDRAAHLLERAGFGGTPEEIQALARMSPQDAVRHLVRYQNVQDVDLPKFHESGIFPSPDFNRNGNGAAFAAILFGRLDKLPAAARAALMDDAKTGVTAENKRIARTDKQAVVDKFYYWNFVDGLETQRVESWLADRMLRTRHPLQEKLVLFWHGHFATGNDKVHDYRKMLGQFSMLRANANGNLRDLLIGIGKDPAMLIYLDNNQNLKGHPNENFAREIMELFSLGVGNYTEKDIKEAARAFTGWTFDKTGQHFANHPELHDEGSKTVLGKTGNFKGEDIVDIILEQPACARFMTRKFYRFFVREDLPKPAEEQLAKTLVENKYEIAPFLEKIFLSRDFYSQASTGTLIKSPVQLVVSTYKKLGLTAAPTYPEFAGLTGGLGQTIFYPPNVKGWDGGRTWINPATIFERENIIRFILFPEQMPVNKDAYLEGSRRLSGDVIHHQFLALAAKGNFTDFPTNGGGMADNSMAKMGAVGAAETSKLSAEDFNLFRGVFNGIVFARQRVPQAPRVTAEFSLARMLRAEGVTDAAGVVDSFGKRFLRVPISGDRRQAVVEFCSKQIGGKLDFNRYTLENELREVLHLILSAPEYQLS